MQTLSHSHQLTRGTSHRVPKPPCAGVLELSPWRQLLQGSEPAPPAERAPLSDPTTGLIDWSPAVATSLDRFWSAERGVEEATQRRRHVAHAELDPKQRDLEYVR